MILDVKPGQELFVHLKALRAARNRRALAARFCYVALNVSETVTETLQPSVIYYYLGS